MTIRRSRSIAIALLFGLGPAPVVAQGSALQSGCLSSEQLRDAVFSGHAIPANAATRAAREASNGDVVRVRLCHHEERLVYRVTMLQRDGRVGHVTIDGSSGKVAEVR
jgi:uncharacterized membrane protein YkoI